MSLIFHHENLSMQFSSIKIENLIRKKLYFSYIFDKNIDCEYLQSTGLGTK